MLTIRLTRKGKKNQPFFRIVVIDKRRSSKGGRAVEVLGYVNPLTKKKSINKERTQYWIKNGAQPSSTMHNLLISEKIIEAKKINVTKKSKKAAAAVATPVAQSAIPETSVSSQAKPEEKPAEEPKPEESKTSASGETPGETKPETPAQ